MASPHAQEARLHAFEAQMPDDIKRRLASAHKDKMSLESCDLRLRVFVVRGLTGTYQVVIAAQPRCSCQDYMHRRKNCKHILFVLSRVLGVADGNPVLWQRTLVASEIAAIFEHAPSQLRQQSAASTSSLSPCRLRGKVSGAWRDRLRGGQFALSGILGCRPQGSMVVSVDKLLGENGRVVKEFTFFESPDDFFLQTALCDVKTFHEVIEIGAWAKLYFDVEHYVSAQHDPDKIAECLAVIKESLLQDFVCVQNNPAVLEDVIILTSSRPTGDRFKHSYHLIFPQIYFHGLVLMRNFVRTFARDPRLQALDSKGAAKSMIDTKVYNINQSLRLIESWKIDPLHGTQVPLRYADDRAPVTLSDLVRTVVSHDDGEDCVRIREEDDSEGGDEGLQGSFPAWPGGFTRVIRHNESDAFAWMQINCGEDGGERLEALRKQFAGSGYMHFLHVRWRKNNKKYLYTWTGADDMVLKAQEIHAALRNLRGTYLKDFSLGAKINNHGTESWVRAGHIIADSALGYLSQDDLDNLVSKAACVVADSVATPGKARDEAVTPEKAREDLEVVAASKVTPQKAKKLVFDETHTNMQTPRATREPTGACAKGYGATQLSRLKMSDFFAVPDFHGRTECTGDGSQHASLDIHMKDLNYQKRLPAGLDAVSQALVEEDQFAGQRPSALAWLQGFDKSSADDGGVAGAPEQTVVIPEEDDGFAGQRPSALAWIGFPDETPADDGGVAGAPEQTVVIPDEDDEVLEQRPSALAWLGCSDKTLGGDAGLAGAPQQTIVIPDEDEGFVGQRPSLLTWLGCSDKTLGGDAGHAGTAGKTGVVISEEEEEDDDDDKEGEVSASNSRDTRGRQGCAQKKPREGSEDDEGGAPNSRETRGLQGRAQKQPRGGSKEGEGSASNSKDTYAAGGRAQKQPREGSEEGKGSASNSKDTYAAGGRAQKRPREGASNSKGTYAAGGRAQKRPRAEGVDADGVRKRVRKLCPHNRRRYACVECGGAGICVHKRRREECIECGGSSICEHKRQRRRCQECGGASICVHKRRMNECKECGGAGICEHQRIRVQCKQCGGARICVHQRQRNNCKECGGTSICIHKRQRVNCKECDGTGICVHMRRRNECKECGGAGICEHQRIRVQCKQCRGASICVHNRTRAKCKECDGNGVCEHNRERTQCKDCLGGNVCPHRNLRHRCKQCPKCSICFTSVAGYGENSSMCLACFRLHAVSTSRPNENALKEYLEKKARLTVQKRDVRKKDEMELKAFLEEMPGLEIVVHDNAVMGADSACPGAKLRPDFQVSSRAIREHLSLWVECDEDAHRSPEYSCELARIWKMYSAVMWKYRVHVVRWNPHAFATGFKASREKFPKERRYEILKQELDRIIKEAQEQPPDFLLKITYICYDCSCGSADVCGFVHHRTYMSEEEVQGDLERGW